MTKELEEFKARLKKERSKIMKEKRQEIFDQCCEVYESISIVELRLIWYLRQFRECTPEYCMETAKYVYRAKRNLKNKLKEEMEIDINKL